MIQTVSVGDILPLTIQISDYDPAKYVQVFLYDETLTEIAQSPSQLSPVGSNGFYSNNEIEMPDTKFLIAQYVVYDDAGYTTVSQSEGGQNDTFIKDQLEMGDVLPLAVQLYDYDPDKFPQAIVTDSDNQAITDSPFDMVALGLLGLYVTVLPAVPDSFFVTAQYIIYDDEDHATRSQSQGGSSDTFFFITGSLNYGGVPNVGDTLLNYYQPMVFSKIVKTIDRFQVSEKVSSFKFMGVWQPFSFQQLNMKPIGQRDWKWFTCHSTPDLVLIPDDKIKFQGTKYRVMAKGDYSLYGFIEYQLVEDYQ